MSDGTNVKTFDASPAPITGAGVEMITTAAAQQIQAQVVLAKRFPRDIDIAYNRIMTACRRKALAEQACYEYPRGGEKVSGPSIRLAEAIAQNWGNIKAEVAEIDHRPGESTVMAYAWDMETNTIVSKTFTVKHERKAKGFIKKLDDPRDIYELTANMGARRLRACILAIIPGDIVEAAVKECEKTLTTGNSEPLRDRIRKMVDKFQTDFQVTKEMLEKYIGCASSAFTEKDVLRLGKVYNSLKDGMAKREAVFDIPAPAAADAETTTFTEQLFKGQTGAAEKGTEKK